MTDDHNDSRARWQPPADYCEGVTPVEAADQPLEAMPACSRSPVPADRVRRPAGRLPRGMGAQRRLHAQRVADEIGDTVLFLEHPFVYTAGKRTEPQDRPIDGTPVVEVDRGGKITWHGPGQLVAYPITKLPSHVYVVDFVRRLEEALIRVCARSRPGHRPGEGSQWRVAAGRRAPAGAQGRRARHPGLPWRDHARGRAELRQRHGRLRRDHPLRDRRRRRDHAQPGARPGRHGARRPTRCWSATSGSCSTGRRTTAPPTSSANRTRR